MEKSDLGQSITLAAVMERGKYDYNLANFQSDAHIYCLHSAACCQRRPEQRNSTGLHPSLDWLTGRLGAAI
jgi:hypothetical protein